MKLGIPFRVEVSGRMKSSFTSDTINKRLDVLREKLQKTPSDQIIPIGKILDEIAYLHSIRRRKKI